MHRRHLLKAGAGLGVAARLPRAFAIAALAAALAAAPRAQEPRPVDTSEGPVMGVEHGGVVSFKGVPFAAPPVGELRWTPPQPPSHRSSALTARAYGAACPQPDRDDGGGVGRMATQSEDCLTLNIWTPPAGTTPARRPVMVWIHGGAHRLGSGDVRTGDGAKLAGIIAKTSRRVAVALTMR